MWNKVHAYSIQDRYPRQQIKLISDECYRFLFIIMVSCSHDQVIPQQTTEHAWWWVVSKAAHTAYAVLEIGLHFKGAAHTVTSEIHHFLPTDVFSMQEPSSITGCSSGDGFQTVVPSSRLPHGTERGRSARAAGKKTPVPTSKVKSTSLLHFAKTCQWRTQSEKKENNLLWKFSFRFISVAGKVFQHLTQKTRNVYMFLRKIPEKGWNVRRNTLDRC